MNKAALTIEELIQTLESLREKFGPHAEVYKRRIKIGDGTTQLMPVADIKIDHKNDAYCITL